MSYKEYTLSEFFKTGKYLEGDLTFFTFGCWGQDGKNREYYEFEEDFLGNKKDVGKIDIIHQKRVSEALDRTITRDNLNDRTFVLVSGDNFYNEPNFDKNLSGYKVPMLATVGNHDIINNKYIMTEIKKQTREGIKEHFTNRWVCHSDWLIKSPEHKLLFLFINTTPFIPRKYKGFGIPGMKGYKPPRLSKEDAEIAMSNTIDFLNDIKKRKDTEFKDYEILVIGHHPFVFYIHKFFDKDGIVTDKKPDIVKYGDYLILINKILPLMMDLNVRTYFCADEHNLQVHDICLLDDKNEEKYRLHQFVIGGGGGRLDYNIYKADIMSSELKNVRVNGLSLAVKSKLAVNIHGYAKITSLRTGGIIVKIYTENGDNFVMYSYINNKLVSYKFDSSSLTKVCEFKNVHEIDYIIENNNFRNNMNKVVKKLANLHINPIELWRK